MLALSIRQPYAELILRGIKTAELRSRGTTIIGQRFYIYASRKWAVGSGQWAGKTGTPQAGSTRSPRVGKTWSEDLRVGTPPGWMIELAKQVGMLDELLGPDADLPTGVIVGSAVIEKVIPPAGEDDLFRWQLGSVQRLARPRKPKGHPQPVWWRPG